MTVHPSSSQPETSVGRGGAGWQTSKSRSARCRLSKVQARRSAGKDMSSAGRSATPLNQVSAPGHKRSDAS